MALPENLMRILFILALTAAAGLCQQPAAPAKAAKVQVLIIAGQNGHDWKATTPVLRKILEDTGRFEVRVTEEFRGAAPETLAPYDVVILNYFDKKKPELRWGERADAALINFVKAGKGVVVYHFATAAFDGWTDYEKLSGGNWRPSNGHHSARHDFEVTVKDANHPIMKGLPAKMPQPSDELYANLKWQPASTYHVLATAWDDHALYNGKAKQPTPGAGLDQPMLWTLDYGKGRVFATALGHDPAAMNSEVFVKTLIRGTEWAATGAVRE